jgi:POT family proton-dependent oligopeptide transporter
MAKDATKSERAKLWAVILLIIGVAIYWSTFELAGSALNLFAARVVDMNAGLFTLKPSQTQSFNSSFILILTPVMAVFWSFLAKRGLEPGVGFKFAGGLALSGTAFSALVIGLSLSGHGNKVGLYWLVLYYLLQTIAEICLSPVGLSMMTKLAPAKLGALVMGLWYMALPKLPNIKMFFITSHFIHLVRR